MRITKKLLNGIAEAIREEENIEVPEAVTVTLKTPITKCKDFICLKIRVDLSKVGDSPACVFLSVNGLRRVIRKGLMSTTAQVQDMSIAIFNNQVHVDAYIWLF